MAQKVATARKMKSRRDSFLRPNCDSDGKADNKRQAFINTDTRRFKFQMGDMGPPPPTPGRASDIIELLIRYFVCKISTFIVLFFP